VWPGPDAPNTGTSAGTIVLNAGVVAEPLDGPAHTVLAFWLTLVIASVPLVVTGDPAMLNSGGTVCATLVTVPLPTLVRELNDRLVLPSTGGVVDVE
jgi:hypothetical protein